jgi:RNA polymerase sigma factor (TIGR02999 family)
VEEKPASEVTQLLRDWRDGDREALDAMLPLVYKELRRLAHFQLRNERPGHTLQTAALVHEAYLRFAGLAAPVLESRTHFLTVAAQFMRQILVDYARRHGAAKRGADLPKVSLEDAEMVSNAKGVDIILLDDALQSLAKIDPRQAQVVELRFFGGLSLAEISEALKIASATVQRDWTAARAWLYREISKKTVYEHGEMGAHQRNSE